MISNTYGNRESVVDGWVRRSIDTHSDSDMYLKFHCIWASPVVGQYALGGTKQIADGIRRSTSTVENHAHAHWMYAELRANGNKRRVRELWRILPASFWWHGWGIRSKGYNAFYYLENAERNKQSVRDMMRDFQRDIDNGTAPMLMARVRLAAVGAARELLEKDRGLTKNQRAATIAFVEAFAENG